jgi:hypothetical protein
VNFGDPRWLVCILEDHSDNAPSLVKNSLVAIDVLNHRMMTLASGHDFYSNPRFNRDGTSLAWRQWWASHSLRKLMNGLIQSV